MTYMKNILDPFLVFLLLFTFINTYILTHTIACVELTTAILVLFVLPLSAITGIVLNYFFFVKKKPIFLQALRYLNFIIAVGLISHYWLFYNTCNTFGNSITFPG